MKGEVNFHSFLREGSDDRRYTVLSKLRSTGMADEGRHVPQLSPEEFPGASRRRCGVGSGTRTGGGGRRPSGAQSRTGTAKARIGYGDVPTSPAPTTNQSKSPESEHTEDIGKVAPDSGASSGGLVLTTESKLICESCLTENPSSAATCRNCKGVIAFYCLNCRAAVSRTKKLHCLAPASQLPVQFLSSWRQGVVPVTVEFMSFEAYLSQLLVAHFDLCWVTIGVKGCFHNQSSPRSGAGDQVDNHFKVHQRARSPVHSDEAEQAMFNLVPFTGTGWKVTDEQLDTQLICQSLQRYLPQP